MGSTVPHWAGGPRLCKKATDQAMGSKPVSHSHVPVWSLPQFLSWFPLMMSCNLQAEISPFLPELLLFIPVKVKQARSPKPQAPSSSLDAWPPEVELAVQGGQDPGTAALRALQGIEKAGRSRDQDTKAFVTPFYYHTKCPFPGIWTFFKKERKKEQMGKRWVFVFEAGGGAAMWKDSAVSRWDAQPGQEDSTGEMGTQSQLYRKWHGPSVLNNSANRTLGRAVEINPVSTHEAP